MRLVLENEKADSMEDIREHQDTGVPLDTMTMVLFTSEMHWAIGKLSDKLEVGAQTIIAEAVGRLFKETFDETIDHAIRRKG